MGILDGLFVMSAGDPFEAGGDNAKEEVNSGNESQKADEVGNKEGKISERGSTGGNIAIRADTVEDT